MLLNVALLSPPYATLSYAVPAWLPEEIWTPGLRIAVPLGKGAVRAGIILSITQEAPGKEGMQGVSSSIVLRPALWPLEASAILSSEYLEMITQLAARQATTAGHILGSVLPQGLRTTARIRVREFQGGAKPRLHQLRELAHMEEWALVSLGQAFMAGQAEVLALREDAAETEQCVLNCDLPWPVRPNAVKQREVLEYLAEHGTVSRRRLADAIPQSSTALTSLVRAGLVTLQPMTAEGMDRETGENLLPPPSPPFTLSTEQQEALANLVGDLDKEQPGTRLLFGVTGSGKTAVYLELAKACLERERSALLLAPEVALALKLRRDVLERFPGTPVFLFHGYQNPIQREATFRALASRHQPCLIIGTRSALFLPLPPLGAIVLDEEHDASFKQDEGFHYQAKEVAWHRAVCHKALLVLGSATPDVKTFYAAQQGQLPFNILSARVGGGSLPAVELLNIKEASSSSLLAPAAVEALKETIRKGEQAVVLLNRRGYAPLMYCLECGKVARCPHCDIGLTYHKKREQLVCHYCGFTRPYPSPCEFCRGLHYLPMGEGTERLEESLAGEHLAAVLGGGGRILRLDRDSARRPGRMEEILTSFARQEAQVLVGTQMLSKGHHFPQVTLAIVADADLGLNLPDYRAAERTFQLLVQSAGRAGRGASPGKVLIQTRDINHYCWQFVLSGDYEGFYEQEIAMREKRRYPPFVKLALIRVAYLANNTQGFKFLTALAAALREQSKSAGIFVLGPAPAPLSRLQGKMRFQFLLKGETWQGIRQLYGQALRQALPKTISRDWKVSLDLDPVNML